jgi:hypothetical protein
MLQYGEWTTEGLALGIANQRDMVVDAMNGISTDVKISAKTSLPTGSTSNNGITIVNQGTIVGNNGMAEFADIISRKISGKFGLSVGGAY